MVESTRVGERKERRVGGAAGWEQGRQVDGIKGSKAFCQGLLQLYVVAVTCRGIAMLLQCAALA